LHSKLTHSLSVSIIIVTHNGRRYLRTCLESLEEQVYDGCQVIVVDNASSDGGPELIEEAFPDVTLLRNSANRGFAAACNQGAAAASGQVLVFLNQDTRVTPGWLDALVNGLLEAGDIGLTTSKVLLMSQPDRIHLCGQDLHYTGLVFGHRFLSPAACSQEPEDVIAVSGASFAIRRDLWELLGGFDETFYMYYEDTDLSWRAQLAGYRSRLIPDSVVYHDFHPSNPGKAPLFYSFRNRVLMLVKNLGWGSLILLAPALLFAELITWVLAFDAGWKGIRAKLRANLWLLSHLKVIVNSHAQVQKTRCLSDAVALKRFTSRLSPDFRKNGLVTSTAVALSNIIFVIYHHFAYYCLAAIAYSMRPRREAAA
jgi:GT2 family glycosyltransferase